MGFTLDELLAHQRRIFSVMDRAEPVFGAANPDAALLELCRGQVSAALTTYQLYKHRELFPLLRSSASGPVRQEGHEIQADCIVLGNDFRAHAARWRHKDIFRQWDEYSRLALQLIARTRVQLARELASARRVAWVGPTAASLVQDKVAG